MYPLSVLIVYFVFPSNIHKQAMATFKETLMYKHDPLLSSLTLNVLRVWGIL
jgi:hypothetical protein